MVTCSPNDSLSAVFNLIKIRRVHRLVVVAGQQDPLPGRLVGIISLSDIMRALIVSVPAQSLTKTPRLLFCLSLLAKYHWWALSTKSKVLPERGGERQGVACEGEESNS